MMPSPGTGEGIIAYAAEMPTGRSGVEPPVDAPDTDLARRAHELLYASCDPQLAAHCQRSFQFAALVAAAEPADVDVEVLYIGTILHDIGLSSRFAGPARFEMRGANAVRAFLRDGGMDAVRAECVWDIIALHASTAIAAHKSTETRIANRGISIDVRGAGAEHLDPAAVRAVLDAHPRLGFPEAFSQMLIDEVRANPATASSSWLECIAAGHVADFERSDFLRTLGSSAHFT